MTEPRKVVLRDLLTEDQLEEVRKILQEPYTLERSLKLRDYLRTQRVELEAKGVVPEYLTYVIEYEQMKALELFEREERKNVENN